MKGLIVKGIAGFYYVRTVSDAKVGDMVTVTLKDGICLVKNVLENGNRLILWPKHP